MCVCVCVWGGEGGGGARKRRISMDNSDHFSDKDKLRLCGGTLYHSIIPLTLLGFRPTIYRDNPPPTPIPAVTLHKCNAGPRLFLSFFSSSPAPFPLLSLPFSLSLPPLSLSLSLSPIPLIFIFFYFSWSYPRNRTASRPLPGQGERERTSLTEWLCSRNIFDDNYCPA